MLPFSISFVLPVKGTEKRAPRSMCYAPKLRVGFSLAVLVRTGENGNVRGAIVASSS